MGKRRDAHLKSDSRKTSENFVHVKYLLRHLFSISDNQCPGGSAQSVKLRPSCGGPAALLPDLCECVSVSRIEIVCSLLRGVSQDADCVKSNDKFLGGGSGAAPSLAVKIDQGPKSLWLSANNCDHQRKPERASTNERFGCAADTDPNGHWILERTRIDRLSRKSSTVTTRPVNMGAVAKLEEKTQLF